MSAPFSQQKPVRRWARPDATAEYTGLALATLERYRSTGDGPPFFKRGRAVWYDLDEVDAWIVAGRARNTAEARINAAKGDDSPESRP